MWQPSCDLKDSDLKRRDQLILPFRLCDELFEKCLDNVHYADFLPDQNTRVLTEKLVLVELFETEKCAVTTLFSFGNFG